MREDGLNIAKRSRTKKEENLLKRLIKQQARDMAKWDNPITYKAGYGNGLGIKQ